MTTPYEEGDPASPICFVAEAPGRYEIIQGRPLVGPSGKIFNNLLQAAGINRSDCYIINVCRERISSIEHLLNKKGVTDEGEEVAADLKERLSRATPNVTVALGKLATALLVGDSRVSKLRGSPLPSTLVPGMEVIPTFHPAYLLPYRGDPNLKHTVISDLNKIKRHSIRPGLQIPERTLLVRPTFGEACEFLTDMGHSDRVAFDIEVYNHQVSCISFANHPYLAMSIPFTGDYWPDFREAIIWQRIADVLGDPNIEKVGQYVTFDISFLLLQNRIRTRGPIFDPYVAHRIMYPQFPASLEFLCSIYTDEPYYKDDRKMWTRPDADQERFWRYNCKDSATTLEIWNALEPDLMADESALATYIATFQNLDPALYMMTKGTRIDIARLKEEKEKARTELEEKREQLNEMTKVGLNAQSPKQCTQYFYGLKGIKPYLNRKTGNPTCDDKALARIIRRYNLPEARLVQQIRGLAKLLSTYLDFQYDADERLRCFYNIRGTTSGRLSSSKTVRGTGMNMQNIHPSFKQFIVPDPPEEWT